MDVNFQGGFGFHQNLRSLIYVWRRVIHELSNYPDVCVINFCCIKSLTLGVHLFRLPECKHAYSLSCIWLLATLWTIAHWAPLSMGFSRWEYWSGWPLLPPGEIFPTHISCISCPAARAFNHEPPGRILEWVAISSCRGDLPNLHLLHCRQTVYPWATRAAPLGA